MYSGVTTNYLARLVSKLISTHPDLTGLFQVAGPPISKYELLCLVRDTYGVDIRITPDDGERSLRTEAVTAGQDDVNLILKVVLSQFSFDYFL